MQSKKLKINTDYIKGCVKDDIVTIFVNDDGVPIDPFWRRRLKEASLDNCCEFIKEKYKKEVKKHDDKRS